MRYFTVLLALITAIGLLSCEKTEDKNPPVAIFVIVPATGPFTEVFTFNSHDSYDVNNPGENLRARWDFDGDGTFDTEYSLNKGIEHQYDAAAHYNVILEVINSEGWTDQEVHTLIVYADSVPPTASFYAEPDSASVNTIFYFNAGASTDPYTSVEDMFFRWDWQNDGTWDTPFSSDSTIYYKYDVPGEYRVLVEVKNSFTLTDTTSRKVIVYDL